jgi:ubiquinone biosynthesis protein COQ9
MISLKLNDMEKYYKINRIKEIVKERIDAYNQVLDAINSLNHIWG